MSDELTNEQMRNAPATADDGVGHATRPYKGELSRSLSIGENVLLTLSAVTPASSLFVIGPAVISGVGGAAVTAYALAAVIGIAVALC